MPDSLGLEQLEQLEQMTPLVLGCRARRTDKLGELDMVEDVDYLLRHVSEQVRKQGGTVISNSYILTPESFKFCLAQAQRSPRQAKAGCSWYGRGCRLPAARRLAAGTFGCNLLV